MREPICVHTNSEPWNQPRLGENLRHSVLCPRQLLLLSVCVRVRVRVFTRMRAHQ